MPDALGWWLSPGCPAPSLSAVAQALQPCHCSRGSYSHWGCVPGEQERLTLPAGSWHVSGLCCYLHFQHRQQQKFPLEAFSLRSYTIFLSNVFCLAEWKTCHPSPLCVLMPFGGSRLPDGIVSVFSQGTVLCSNYPYNKMTCLSASFILDNPEN